MVRAVFEALAILFSQSISPEIWGAVLASGIVLLTLLFWRLRVQRRARLEQAAFSRQLIAVQEEERARIARELHDGLGQDLLVIKNTAAVAASKCTGPEPEHWKQVSDLSSSVLSELRDISHDLRPPVLDSLGLTRALRSMASQLSESAGLECEVALEDIDDLLPPEVEISLYRAAQELVGNAVRHSNCAVIKLLAKPVSGEVLLRVSDDGSGYSPGRLAKRGLGINSVRERVALLGGEYDVDTAKQQGTQATVRIPIPEKPLTPGEQQRQRQRLAISGGVALAVLLTGILWLVAPGQSDDSAEVQARVEAARATIHQALGLPKTIPAKPVEASDSNQPALPEKPEGVSEQAFAAFNEGMRLRYLFERENLLKTEKHFSEAVRLAPDFAEAHAQLAMTISNCAALGVHESIDSFREAERHAEEAMRLNPDNATAWFALANIQLHHHYNPTQAMHLLQKAIEIDPDYAQAYSKLAIVKYVLGDLNGAGHSINTALELEPNNGMFTVTLADIYERYLYHNRVPFGHKLIRDQLRAGLTIEPSYTFLHDRILMTYYHEGNYERGMAYMEANGLDKKKDNRVWLYLIGANWKMGNRAESDRHMREFQEYILSGNGAKRFLAIAHAERGEGAESLHWLEQSRLAKEPFLLFTLGLIEPEQHTWNKPGMSDKLNTFKADIGLSLPLVGQ